MSEVGSGCTGPPEVRLGPALGRLRPRQAKMALRSGQVACKTQEGAEVGRQTTSRGVDAVCLGLNSMAGRI